MRRYLNSLLFQRVTIGAGITSWTMLLTLPVVAALGVNLIMAFWPYETFIPQQSSLSPASSAALDTTLFNGVVLFLRLPGAFDALTTTLLTGVASTVIALAMAVVFCATTYQIRWHRLLDIVLLGIYAIPHAALATALTSLLGAAGIVWRVGIDPLNLTPPSTLLFPDRHGISLVIALALKEFVFLAVVIRQRTRSTDCTDMLIFLRTAGFSPMMAWYKGALPLIYPSIRLVTVTVLTYAMSVVDMAEILMSGNASTLASMVVKQAQHVDISRRILAAGGSVVLLAAVAGVVVGALTFERALQPVWLSFWLSGKRRWLSEPVLRLTTIAMGVCVIGLAIVSILVLLMRAVAYRWPYPELWPQFTPLPTFTSTLPFAMLHALTLAISTALVALLTVILMFEIVRQRLTWNDPLSSLPSQRYTQLSAWGTRMLDTVMLLPLLTPQIMLVFGWQVIAETLSIPRYMAVFIGHFFYVTPYVYFVVRASLENYDHRYTLIGRTMGLRPSYTLWTVKFPMLLGILVTAATLAATVSNTQYLPTQLLSAGRFNTPTTLTVIYASGGTTSTDAASAAVTQLLTTVILLTIGAGILATIWRRRGRSCR